MTAQQIAMYRGDDATFPFTLTQGGVTVDLTGYTVTFSARVAADFAVDEAAPVIVTAALAAAQDTTGKGKVTVTIPDTVSVDLAPGLYLCDLEANLGSLTWTWPEPVYGQSTLIRLRVKADVTHA